MLPPLLPPLLPLLVSSLAPPLVLPLLLPLRPLPLPPLLPCLPLLSPLLLPTLLSSVGVRPERERWRWAAHRLLGQLREGCLQAELLRQEALREDYLHGKRSPCLSGCTSTTLAVSKVRSLLLN